MFSRSLFIVRATTIKLSQIKGKAVDRTSIKTTFLHRNETIGSEPNDNFICHSEQFSLRAKIYRLSMEKKFLLYLMRCLSSLNNGMGVASLGRNNETENRPLVCRNCSIYSTPFPLEDKSKLTDCILKSLSGASLRLLLLIASWR